MSEDGPSAESGPPDDADDFDEIREAAGAVIASLKRLIDATERVVENPETFAKAVGNGRNVVEAFVGGFAAQAADPSPTPESDSDTTL